MRNPFTAIALGITIGFTCVAAVSAIESSLDRAARLQCDRMAWPAEQHQAHMDFCRMYVTATE